MAQYDIRLEQNVHATLVEYSEKFIHLSKGDLLSADTSHVPTVLAAGTDGYYLKRDDAETTGLKWVTAPGGCTLSGVTDNTICTVTGANAIQGEANLTWNSSNVLGIAGDINFSGADRTILGGAGTAAAGYDVIIRGGTGGATNYAGGDVHIRGGTPNGSGVYGKLYLGCSGAGVSYVDETFIQPSATGTGYTSLLAVDVNCELYSITFSNHAVADYVVTTDTSGGLNGEANLTFDGSYLSVTSYVVVPSATGRYVFGTSADGDSYFYEQTDDTYIRLCMGSTDRWLWGTGTFCGVIATAGAVLNEAVTATNPTLCPDRSDLTLGIGGSGTSDYLSLIVASTEYIRLTVTEVTVTGNIYLATGADRTIKVADGTTTAYDLTIRAGYTTSAAQAGDLYLYGGQNANGNGGFVYIYGGQGTGAGGTTYIYGGTGSGTGGPLYLIGGSGGSGGGSLYIRGGDGTATDGTIYIGDSTTTYISLGSAAVGSATAEVGEYLFLDATDGYLKKATNSLVSVTPTPVDGQIAVWTSATNLEGTTALTYSSDKVTLTESYNGDVGFTISNTSASNAARAVYTASSDGATMYLMATGTTYATTQWGLAGSDVGELMASSSCSRVIIGYNTTAASHMYLAVGPIASATAVSLIDLYYYSTDTQMYVGIGAAAIPTSKLYVYQNLASTWAGYFYNDSSTGDGLYVKTDGTTTSEYALQVETGGTGAFEVYADGSVSINSTSGVPLYIGGVIDSSVAWDWMEIQLTATTTLGIGEGISIRFDGTSDQLGYLTFVRDTATAGYGKFLLQVSKSTLSTPGVYDDIIIDSAGDIWLGYTGNTPLVTIYEYVGIGIAASSSYNLRVDGNTYVGTYLGIGVAPSSSYALYAYKSATSQYAALFQNAGAASTAWGINIRAGSTSYACARWINFDDSDGTQTGWISSTNSTDIAIVAASDVRLKTNIDTYSADALQLLECIPINTFEFIKQVGLEGHKPRVGYIAQYVEPMFPDMVEYDEISDVYGVKKQTLIPIMHKGINQLYNQTKDHESRIKVLEDELQALKSTIVT
jgi:hypothetical protein